MEGDKLPDSFDVVIIGTGLGEAIVAASLSRIGKSVLHIDRNDYYGSHWATFNFDSILKWADCYQKCNEEEISDENDKVPSHDSAISNIEIRSFIPETSPVNDIAENEETSSEKDSSAASNSEKEDVPSNDENTPAEANCENESTEQPSINQEAVTDNSEGVEPQEDEQQKSEEKPKPSFFNLPKQSTIVSQAKIKQKSPDISLEDFNALSRRFNLDVNPKFLFSAGPLVNAIIKANISHYSEFQVVNRILTCKNDSIIEVPCNRSDIFSSSFLSMIEKRTLMKFLTLCLEFDADSQSEDVKKYQEKSFVEFLQSRRLSENLQKFIIFSIAMVKPNTSTLEGLKETCSFLKSLGRYGKSPFIWPLYGVGELPQAFCRMSAVFGALYCLGKSPVELKIEENKCTHVVLENQTIKCAHVVMNRSFLPQSYLNPSVSRNKVSKAILITNGSILPSETEFISFLTIPPLAGKEELVRVIELGPSAAACPAGLYVLYLTCKSTGKALQDLEDYVHLLTETQSDDKPKLLWSIYFNELADNSDVVDLPENLSVTTMPGSSLGFKDVVENAEMISKRIFPDGEFLMTVPNAEDIVWDTDKTQEEKNEEGNENGTTEEEKQNEQDLEFSQVEQGGKEVEKDGDKTT